MIAREVWMKRPLDSITRLAQKSTKSQHSWNEFRQIIGFRRRREKLKLFIYAIFSCERQNFSEKLQIEEEFGNPGHGFQDFFEEKRPNWMQDDRHPKVVQSVSWPQDVDGRLKNSIIFLFKSFNFITDSLGRKSGFQTFKTWLISAGFGFILKALQSFQGFFCANLYPWWRHERQLKISLWVNDEQASWIWS